MPRKIWSPFKDYPPDVVLREEGPREGFQNLAHLVPTALKLKLIESLATTGISSIEVSSFVRPDKVPQHADAEELCRSLPHIEGVRYRALYLNERGFERAVKIPTLQVEGTVMISPSEKFLAENNGSSVAESVRALPRWQELFTKRGVKFERLMVSTAFGYAADGRIPAEKVASLVTDAVTSLQEIGVSPIPEVTLADTTGYANPSSVQRLIGVIRERFPEVIIGLHLHDTRGTGMANVLAGLQMGVRHFDCSVGGLGGCPFATGAAGNVPTEDVAYMCEEMGVRTGVDLDTYVACAKLAENIASRPLPGKLKDAGTL